MINEDEQKLYDILKKLGIEYTTYEHKPIYTIEEAFILKAGFNFKTSRVLSIIKK